MMTIVMKQRQPSSNENSLVDEDEEDEDHHNNITIQRSSTRIWAKKKPSATTSWWSSSIQCTAIFIIFNTFVDPISTLIYDGISEYHVMEGDTISLPCNISIKEWNQNQISLMVWYRSSNQGNPIYSIDTRSSLSKSRHQIMPELNERIEMDFDQDPPRLHLDSVRSEDAGDYRCRVDYRMNRTKHFLIHLNVSVAPKNVVIRDLLGNIVQGMIQTPFNEGDKVTLFCDAIGGSPPPIVIWKNDDGKIIDDSFELLSNNDDHDQTNENATTVRNILYIPQLDRGHLLQEITCEAYPPLLLTRKTTNATEESIPKSNWTSNNPSRNNHHHHHHHHQRNSFVRRTSVVFDLNLRPLSVKIQVPNFQPNLNRSLAGTSSSSSFQSPSSSSFSTMAHGGGGGGPTTPNHQLNRGNVLIVSAGKKQEIECRSWGSRPSAEITWWRASRRLPTSASRTYYGSGKLIRPSSSSSISSSDDEDSSSSSSSSTSLEQTADNDNLTISMLTYTAAPEDDGQRLTCRADNVHLEQEEIEDSVILSVRYAPLLALSLGAKIPENIREGSDVYLECVSKSNPPLSEVVWLFEGKPLIHNPVQGILVTNQSLVMQRVRREHRGYYQCAASNPEGISASNKVFLNVHFAPVCKPTQTIIYGVARTEQVQVSCEVEAEPISPIQFRWFFNNSFENLELPMKDYTVEIIHPNHTNSMNELERKFFNNPDMIHRLSLENVFTTIATMNQHYQGQAPSVARSNATYWPRTRIGYGLLYCLAENSVGPQRDPCVFTIVEAGPPNPVHDCRIVNVTMASFILECIPGENGGLRQLFHLEVYNIEKEHLQANVTSMDEPVFAVENLPHDTAFMLNVFSSNAKGRSDSVTLRTATSAYAAKHTTNGKKQKALIFDDINQLIINPIFGALMVALFSLVLLCMATIVFIRSRFCLKNSTAIRNGNHKAMVDNCIPSSVQSSNKNDGETTKCNDHKFTPSLSSACTPIMPSSSPLSSHHHPHLLIGSQQQQHQFATTVASNLNQSTYYDYQPHIGAGPNTTSLSITDSSTHTTMTDLSYHKHLEPNSSYFMTSANHLPPTSSTTNQTVSAAVSTMLHPHLPQNHHNRFTATTSDLMTNAFTYNVNATSLNNTVYPITDDFVKVNTDLMGMGMANCPYNNQLDTTSNTITTIPRRVPLLKPIIGCMESLSSSTSDKTNDPDEEWSHLVTGHPTNSHPKQIDLPPPPSSSSGSSFVQFQPSSGPINAQNSVNS